MLDHLTTQVQLALSQAEAVAHRLAHDYLGTEHLLAGLAYTDEPAARRVLARCGLDGATVEAHLETTLGRGRHALSVRPPLTASATLALARSRWEARAFGRDVVAGAHLLLALVRHTDSAASTVLRELGVDLVELEALLVEAAPAGAGREPPSPPVGADLVPSSDAAGEPRTVPPLEATSGEDQLSTGPAPFADEPLAFQVVRLTHQLARLERQVAELTARLDAAPSIPPSVAGPPDGEAPPS